jgi:hypothetical protein
MSPPAPHRAISRRRALLALAGVGIAAASVGCGSSDVPSRPVTLPAQEPGATAPAAEPYADALDALADVLLPAERDASGRVVGVGAREARVDLVLDAARFAPLAVGLGLTPQLSDAATAALATSGDAFRTALNLELDALATLERPLAGFKDLPADLQEKIVARALDDERLAPSILLVRAACMAAFLGGVATDAGMVAVGLPPYEDHEGGLATSGYPRRLKSQHLVDAETEDLFAIAAANDLDDYTYNRAPFATPGDDLSAILDERGDIR